MAKKDRFLVWVLKLLRLCALLMVGGNSTVLGHRSRMPYLRMLQYYFWVLQENNFSSLIHGTNGYLAFRNKISPDLFFAAAHKKWLLET